MAGTSRGKNILDDYASLSINDDDEGGLVVEEPSGEKAGQDYTHCLVGRLLTNRKVNFMAMQDTLSAIWRPVKGVFMEATSYPNIFLFKFFHERDVSRVLEDGPWTFNQQTLIIKKLEMDEQLANVELFEINMWVQVYELPIGFKSEFILTSIGNYVGKFIKSDPRNFQGMWRSFLRIQVTVDVRRPLRSKMRIKKSGGEWLWIKFKYERLPSFCFYCGRIGHTEKFCEALFDNPEEKDIRRYDSSIRAQMQRQSSTGTNQWLRGPDGRWLNSMEEGEIPVEERMRVDRELVTVDGAGGGHDSTNLGSQVVMAPQNVVNRDSNPIKGVGGDTSYGRPGIIKDLGVLNKGYGQGENLVADKLEGMDGILNIGGKDGLDINEINGLTFREQKRSRTDEPIQIGPTGNNEHTDLEMADTTNNVEEVPKNMLKAGTAVQSRQSL